MRRYCAGVQAGPVSRGSKKRARHEWLGLSVGIEWCSLGYLAEPSGGNQEHKKMRWLRSELVWGVVAPKNARDALPIGGAAVLRGCISAPGQIGGKCNTNAGPGGSAPLTLRSGRRRADALDAMDGADSEASTATDRDTSDHDGNRGKTDHELVGHLLGVASSAGSRCWCWCSCWCEQWRPPR